MVHLRLMGKEVRLLVTVAVEISGVLEVLQLAHPAQIEDRIYAQHLDVALVND